MTGGDPQPGRRPPAPGQLALLQAFLNTHFDLGQAWGEEVLASPGALAAWLARRGLLDRSVHVQETDRRQALAVRAALREAAGGCLDALQGCTEELSTRIAFEPNGPRFTPDPRAGVAGALGALTAIAATAMLDGTWSRLKICPGEHCGWAFYDASRNRSGRWCSMSVCGGRTKARAHYRRSRAWEPE